MSVTPVGSNPNQSIGSLLLQQLMAADGGGSQAANAPSGPLSDLLTLSPAAQRLSQAPNAVAKAMGDLLSSQNDVQGDLAQVKSYFQKNPQGLASVLSSLQGSGGLNGTSNPVSSSTLLTALMNGQANASNPAALLSLMGGQGQDSLFASLGGSGSGSDNGSPSIFG
jgi:hypothetical protein